MEPPRRPRGSGRARAGTGRLHALFEATLADARRHLALLRGEVAPSSLEETILLAKLHYSAREPARAAAVHRTALATEAVRADLDPLYLFHAASAAALAAAAEPDATKGEALAAEALAWLGEDLRRRRARLAEAEGAPAGPERDARVATLKEDLAGQLERLRSAADLASLRSRPEFSALLE